MKRTSKGRVEPDPEFAAAIAESQRRHHEAWLAREPGDGLVIDWVDPKDSSKGETRVQGTRQHFSGGRMDWTSSRLVSR